MFPNAPYHEILGSTDIITSFILGFTAFFSTVVSCLLGHLLCFHAWLTAKKQTAVRSVFNLTAGDVFAKRRRKHLWRICKAAARKTGYVHGIMAPVGGENDA